MNYPVWELQAAGGGLLIALVAVIHVYIAHFAVGGGLLLVLTEIKARRMGSQALLDYARHHTKFFLLLTMVLGSPQASGTAWGPGDTLTYTLDLSNLESDSSVNDLTVGLSASTGLTYQTVSGATCADCSSGDSWQLSVPALPAGGSQHITVTAELAPAATLGSLHNVTTTVTLEWNASTLAQGSLTHRVDGQPPSVAVEHLPGQVLAPGKHFPHFSPR